MLPADLNIDIALQNPHAACLRPLQLLPLHLQTTDGVFCPRLVNPAVMQNTAYGAAARTTPCSS